MVVVDVNANVRLYIVIVQLDWLDTLLFSIYQVNYSVSVMIVNYCRIVVVVIIIISSPFSCSSSCDFCLTGQLLGSYSRLGCVS